MPSPINSIKIRSLLAIVAVSCLLWFSTKCIASIDAQIDIRIEAAGNEILIQEALPIMINWRVVGDFPIRASHISMDSGATSIHVQSPSGQEVRITQMSADPPPYESVPRQMLERGESESEEVVVSCAWPDVETPVFDEEGEYKIWVEFNDEGTVRKSNSIKLDVQAPVGPENDALKLVRTLKPAGILYDVALIPPFDNSATDVLEKLARLTESEVYASYARVALATKQMNTVKYNRYMGARPEDLLTLIGKAEELLKPVSLDVKTLKFSIENLRQFIEFERRKVTDSQDAN